MRVLAITALLAVLAAGLAITYVAYRQLETGTVVVQAAPVLQETEAGLCGRVEFTVDARKKAEWYLPVEKGQIISGTVVAGGTSDMDIGFQIEAPNNRLVFLEVERQHEFTFELPPSIRGEYRFEFDNRHSTFTDKTVTVDLCLR